MCRCRAGPETNDEKEPKKKPNNKKTHTVKSQRLKCRCSHIFTIWFGIRLVFCPPFIFIFFHSINNIPFGLSNVDFASVSTLRVLNFKRTERNHNDGRRDETREEEGGEATQTRVKENYSSNHRQEAEKKC